MVVLEKKVVGEKENPFCGGCGELRFHSAAGELGFGLVWFGLLLFEQ